MSGRRILDDAQIDKMAELREQGWSCERIARHFRARGTPISAGSIHWQCLRVGADLPARKRRILPQPGTYERNGRQVRPFTADEDALILELRGQGVGPDAIGRRLDPPRRSNSIRGRLMTLARNQARQEEPA